MERRDLLQALDDLGWSHDEKYLREVLNSSVLPSLAYVSELMAALALRRQPLRPSEMSYWTGALYEEQEVFPARFLAAGEELGIARIMDGRDASQNGQKKQSGRSVQSDRDEDGSAGEEGFEPSIA